MSSFVIANPVFVNDKNIKKGIIVCKSYWKW